MNKRKRRIRDSGLSALDAAAVPQSGDARQRAGKRGDEMRALVGKRQPARLEHVAGEEKAGERKAVGEIARRRRGIGSSRRKAGRRSSLSAYGSPAARETARPDFGET